MKSACLAFANQWCESLKTNNRLPERQTRVSQEIGFRLPVLQKELDPFDPADCYRQWWLTEATFASDEAILDTQGTRLVVHPPSDFAGFAELSPDYFAWKDEMGKLQFPRNYDIARKYSAQDQALLRDALKAAYKYADVNVAIRDGYAPQPYYDEYMGVHFTNLSLLDETIDVNQPEFLAYIKSRRNNTYALAQLGYIQVRNNNMSRYQYPLFDTREAHGHNHFLSCAYVDEFGWWKQISITSDEPTKKEINIPVGPLDKMMPMQSSDALDFYNDTKSKKHLSPHRVERHDSLWMMHVSVNLYNEDGLFADIFPLVDTMTTTGEIYSFFGRKLRFSDYVQPSGQQAETPTHP